MSKLKEFEDIILKNQKDYFDIIVKDNSYLNLKNILNDLSVEELALFFKYTKAYDLAVFISKEDEEFWINLIKKCGHLVLYYKDGEKSLNLFKEAIKQNLSAFFWIEKDKLTIDICIFALEIGEFDKEGVRNVCFERCFMVNNPDYPTTLKNLYAKKSIIDCF